MFFEEQDSNGEVPRSELVWPRPPEPIWTSSRPRGGVHVWGVGTHPSGAADLVAVWTRFLRRHFIFELHMLSTRCVHFPGERVCPTDPALPTLLPVDETSENEILEVHE